MRQGFITSCVWPISAAVIDTEHRQRQRGSMSILGDRNIYILISAREQ